MTLSIKVIKFYICILSLVVLCPAHAAERSVNTTQSAEKPEFIKVRDLAHDVQNYAWHAVSQGLHLNDVHLSQGNYANVSQGLNLNEAADNFQAQLRGIDQNVTVPVCSKPINYAHVPTNNYQYLTVIASCKSPSWNLNLSLVNKLTQPVVVAKKHVSKNQVIGDVDLDIQQIDILGLFHEVYSQKQALLGKISKQDISVGKIINPKLITAPIAIKQGQVITLNLSEPGITINTQGIALENGSIGDTIKVINSSSKVHHNAVIINHNLVNIV